MEIPSENKGGIQQNQSFQNKGTLKQKGKFVFQSEEERLLADINRPDIEKLQLFTQMIRRNRMLDQFKKAR
ncbi:hypothetical protein [Parasegetibacter sp. NRK P23]|uniref:hypothetical protein n=1 Tax=Parasegetibacter sp. NRK P23 TaxID=2942999 RepID=UPI002042D9B3|nr:hypothetical protein [Parasegetibacter sp. NRK P23]MCM5527492.1 hypothetical protein [Parasegetibacter sp. NRK P23]